MFPRAALVTVCFAAAVLGQLAGSLTPEVHPSLPTMKCTKSGGCVTVNTKITLDANWRWLHNAASGAYNNCYDGNKWDATLCPDPVTCMKNCALEGVDYASTYGISVSGNALNLKFVTNKNVGSRVYLMADDSSYQMFNLVGQEFAMDVDMSNLPCGLNGAVYFSEMEKDGGLSKYSTNKAGAKYGTGYCDSQCPHDIKYINGEANLLGWNGTSANSGSGQYGACCAEMDIWEANSQAAAYTPHPCSGTGPQRCTGSSCGDGDDRYAGICDKDGCDWNSYRMGDKGFLGAGSSFTIDTTKKFSLITQFISSDGTQSGTLTEIRRVYVQNGKVISNSQSKVSGVTGNSLTDSFCAVQKGVFDNNNYFKTVGGMAGMGSSFKRGMVLALSLWDDYTANALWLDSTYPVDQAGKPGADRGPCGTDTGKPADVESKYPNANVIFSNIKWGEIGSTFTGTESSVPSGPGGSTTTSRSSTTTSKTSTTTSRTSTTSPSPTGGAVAEHYAQCGGKGWTGATVCRSPYTCKASGEYYSQCL